MRSRILNLLLACLVIGAGFPLGAFSTRAAISLSDLGARLESDTAGFSGAAGIAVADPATGFFYGHDADRVFPSASLYKLGVMVEAYRAASAGQLSLDTTTITITSDDLTDDGYYTPEGVTLSVREAIERMITISDNSPAIALVSLLGASAIDATVASVGLTDTRLNFYRTSDRTADYNTTTARDMTRLFVGLLKGTVISAAASAEMLGVLGRQQVNDRLSTGFPSGTRFAHKTGDLDGVMHDAGVVWTANGPRVIIALTADYAERDAAIALDGQIAADSFSAQISRFSASLVLAPSPAAALGTRSDEVVTRSILVTNTSSFTWSGAELGAHWRGRDGQLIQWDGLRTALPTLLPGQSATVSARAFVSVGAGSYTLEWEPLIEGVAWSGDRLALPVTIDKSIALQARLAAAGLAPTVIAPAKSFPLAVAVTNSGTQAWTAAMTPPLRLGYHWRDAVTGAIVIWDGGRAMLPALAPGASGTVSATVLAPAQPGVYVLEWDLVIEGVSWMSTTGELTLRTAPIIVR
ncbi:MAG: hypothetical protein NVS1B1_04040 [Candidatus Limnocylindrales bacterium]